MSLDLKTIVLCAGIVQVLNSLVMVWHALVHRNRVNGPRWWALGTILFTLGFFLLVTRGHIPDFFSIVIANSILIGGIAAYRHGLAEFNGKSTSFQNWFLSAFVLISGLCVFTYYYNSVFFRIVLVSLFVMIYTGWCLLEIRSIIAGKGSQGILLLGGSLLVLFLFNLTRLFYTLLEQQNQSHLFTDDWLQIMFFLSIILNTVSVCYGFIVLISVTLQQELTIQANHDYLTNLYNRRPFLEMGNAELSKANRKDAPLCIILIDLDFFKTINDQYGHHIGDQALQSFAQALKNSIRNYDLCARIGGEEFCILLPETTITDGLNIVFRIRDFLLANPFVVNSTPVPIFFSAGICISNKKYDDISYLLQHADKYLYQAKESGRGKIAGPEISIKL